MVKSVSIHICWEHMLTLWVVVLEKSFASCAGKRPLRLDVRDRKFGLFFLDKNTLRPCFFGLRTIFMGPRPIFRGLWVPFGVFKTPNRGQRPLKIGQRPVKFGPRPKKCCFGGIVTFELCFELNPGWNSSCEGYLKLALLPGAGGKSFDVLFYAHCPNIAWLLAKRVKKPTFYRFSK